MNIFKSFRRVFQINWNNILNEISPRGNKLILNEPLFGEMVKGIILVVISNFLVILLSWIVSCKIYSVPILIFEIIISVLLLLYISNKSSEKDPGVLFVSFIITSLAMVLSFLSIVLFLPYLFNNIGAFFLSLLFCLVDTLGFSTIVVSLFDYLKLARCKYDEDHKVESSEVIKLSTIGINDISMHGVAVCEYCKNSISVNDIFCPNCGKKLK